MKVYLCSRVSEDARPVNKIVASSLRKVGYQVYVPHEQAPNNLTSEDIEAGRYDTSTIFKLDFAAMTQSDICVVVGRVGKDCSWEIGWFYAKNIPIYFIPAGDYTYMTSPMLIPALRDIVEDASLAGEIIKEREARLESLTNHDLKLVNSRRSNHD